MVLGDLIVTLWDQLADYEAAQADAACHHPLQALRGVHDIIYVHFPVNSDAEAVFSIHAGADREPFAEADVVLASRVLRGIKWFHRRLLLGHGLMIALSPLSPAERRVLTELLTDAPEKEIARRLDLAPSTVHQYAVSIYRKFAVKGRTGMMSLWLNRTG